MSQVARVQPVVPADDMDWETFAKHFTLRHRDSLAGMFRLIPVNDYGLEQAYRAFHDRLHAIRTGLGHDHECRK